MSPSRSRWLAAAILGGQLLVLAARSPDPHADAPTLLAGATFRLLAPVLGFVASVGDGFDERASRRRSQAELERQNARFAAELAALRLERLRLTALDEEVERLSRATGYARASGLELRAAEVVFADRGAWLSALVVRAGARGARRDQAVVTADGVVGRVIEANGPWAKVQLVTDRAAAVSVELELARRQGIAKGEGDELTLDYVPRPVDVRVGERVLTAGIDGVYPRGLPVGVVIAVEPGSELFHKIRVRPSAELGELSLVFLVERGGEIPRTGFDVSDGPAGAEGGDGGR